MGALMADRVWSTRRGGVCLRPAASIVRGGAGERGGLAAMNIERSPRGNDLE